MLNSGQVDLSAYLPDRNRWRLGLLKHAFVAACLQFGAFEGAEADAVRGDLIADRDAPTRHDVPEAPSPSASPCFGHDGPVVEWPVVYALANVDGTPTHGVLLGGTTFVSWSSEPRDEVAHGAQLSVPLVVGARLEGVVSSVQP